jgi:hypothetical protein
MVEQVADLLHLLLEILNVVVDFLGYDIQKGGRDLNGREVETLSQKVAKVVKVTLHFIVNIYIILNLFDVVFQLLLSSLEYNDLLAALKEDLSFCKLFLTLISYCKIYS